MKNINILITLVPDLFIDSEVFLGADYYSKMVEKYTDNHGMPYIQINGLPFEDKEELEYPISEELDRTVRYCEDIASWYNCKLLRKEYLLDKMKLEYHLYYDKCQINCIFAVADNPFDTDFLEEAKPDVLKYLTMNQIVDRSRPTLKAGMNFRISEVQINGKLLEGWAEGINEVADLIEESL